MSTPDELCAAIAAAYGALPDVGAVVHDGSRATGASDDLSDIDLVVYCRKPLDLTARQAIAARLGRNVEVGNEFWESGDEWDAGGTPLHVDVVFRTQAWIEGQLESVLDRHQARLGFTTCLWHNVLHSRLLLDPSGWFANLQRRCRCPYPDGLRLAIVRKNFPVLDATTSSYVHQIELALARRDLVSVNHRVAAFIASYFDVLFAINRLPHPGEKRLFALARESCALIPAAMESDIGSMLSPTSTDNAIVAAAKHAAQGLEELLAAEKLLP